MQKRHAPEGMPFLRSLSMPPLAICGDISGLLRIKRSSFVHAPKRSSPPSETSEKAARGKRTKSPIRGRSLCRFAAILPERLLQTEIIARAGKVFGQQLMQLGIKNGSIVHVLEHLIQSVDSGGYARRRKPVRRRQNDPADTLNLL